MRASPSGALELDERLHADPAQLTQVLDHAHAVLQAVAPVQLPKASTRVRVAVHAERFRALRKVLAPPDAAHTTVMRLGGVVLVVAAGAGPAVAEVTDADSAVHAARSDEPRREWVGLH